MDVDRIWTAAELEALTPNERDEVIRAGFVTDVTLIEPAVIERARRKAEARIALDEGTPTSR
jgi:hypothetical protein